MNFVSYKELIQDTENLCEVNPQWRNLAGVVGIPRSGMIPASQIAMRFNLPLVDLRSFLTHAGCFYSFRNAPARNPSQRILLVDDSTWSGNSLRSAIQDISIHPLLNSLIVEPVAIYGNPDLADFYCQRKLASPRMFEWNWQRNDYLQETMTDLDGILCYDPNPTKTRDIAYYNDWISNPIPKHLLSQKVRAIVSSRLEKYRAETEYWLNTYKIQYQELVLLDCTEEERHIGNLHAEHKVRWFSNSNSPLFIESDLAQARHIHRRVNKAVLCPATSAHPSIFFKKR